MTANRELRNEESRRCIREQHDTIATNMKRPPLDEIVEAALFGGELGSGVPELDLHGLSAHEALRELDTFIYQRHPTGAVLRIIHGRGTQTLRTAVHKWLDAHKTDVAAFRDSRNPAETGGVTIVVLR